MASTRLLICAGLSALIAGQALAQTAAVTADRHDWENPAVSHIGAEPMHSTFAGFETRAAALYGAGGAEPGSSSSSSTSAA